MQSRKSTRIDWPVIKATVAPCEAPLGRASLDTNEGGDVAAGRTRHLRITDAGDQSGATLVRYAKPDLQGVQSLGWVKFMAGAI